MELEYVLMDPTGNLTALVRTAVPVDRQPALAQALMDAEPSAEQVGFLSPGGDGADTSLRMAGGEFCGNATMCAAALFAAARGAEEADVSVRVSGARELVRVHLAAEPDGSWRCAELLPERPSAELVTLPLNGGELRVPLLRFDGISHLILPGDLDRGLAERAAPDWCAALGAEALGCMLLDEAAGRLTPLVWVPGAQTLFWEHSCASGTAAVGAWSAVDKNQDFSVELKQPGGSIGVSVEYSDETMKSLVINGKVRISSTCSVELDI